MAEADLPGYIDGCMQLKHLGWTPSANQFAERPLVSQTKAFDDRVYETITARTQEGERAVEDRGKLRA